MRSERYLFLRQRWSEFVRDTKPEMLADTPANRGAIIAVWGPGGGVGRSALVRDLAALAPNVVVVDADSHRPA